MATAILLGFSTAGKSTILANLEKKYGSRLQTIDTDSLISHNYGGHIYNIFFTMVHGRDRKRALDHIEQREREILETLEPPKGPCLIGAGPFLPTREPQWSRFVQRVDPTCFYLELSVEEVYAGLIKRRKRHESEGLGTHPAFGSWDEGITTEFRDSMWVPVQRVTALANIRKNMAVPAQVYERECAGRRYQSHQLRNNLMLRNEFYSDVSRTLGIVGSE